MGELNLDFGFQARRPDHTATLPPLKGNEQSFFFGQREGVAVQKGE